jgi:hypothetical protein
MSKTTRRTDCKKSPTRKHQVKTQAESPSENRGDLHECTEELALAEGPLARRQGAQQLKRDLTYQGAPWRRDLGLKVQRALVDLDLLFEAVLPDFNHYDGAQAIGSRADLYRLRPTRRTDRIAVRVAARYGKTLYTHGNQSEESAAPRTARSGGPDAVAQAVREKFGGDPPPLLVGDGWASSSAVAVEQFLSADRSPRHAATTIIDLRSLFGWSLIRAALTATSDQTVIIVPRDAYGLRSATESAQLRAALAPRYQVQDVQRPERSSSRSAYPTR